MFILALNSADQLVLFYRSGLVTLPLTAEEEGWGGESECVCLPVMGGEVVLWRQGVFELSEMNPELVYNIIFL